MMPLVTRTCSALADLSRTANRDRSIEIYDTHAALIAFFFYMGAHCFGARLFSVYTFNIFLFLMTVKKDYLQTTSLGRLD